MIRNLDVSEGLVGCCLASPEPELKGMATGLDESIPRSLLIVFASAQLWTREQVVQGLRVGGSCLGVSMRNKLKMHVEKLCGRNEEQHIWGCVNSAIQK